MVTGWKEGGSPGISRSDIDYSLMELNFTTELKRHLQQSSKKKWIAHSQKKKKKSHTGEGSTAPLVEM